MVGSSVSDALRLLVVGSRWPAESFLERLFRGLADESLQIYMALKEDVEIDHPHIHSLLLPEARGLFGTSLLRGRRTGAGGRDVRPYLKEPWDLIYFPWNSAAVALLPLMQTGIPTIVSCRGSQILIAPHVPGREGLTDRFPEMFEHATAVHCVSQDILDASVALGLEPAKARIITPAVDGEVFCPPRDRATGNELQVVGVGSLIWRKGFEDALVALGKIRDQGVGFHYHVVGDGPDRQRLLFTAHDLGLEDRVTFHGSLDAGQLVPLLQRSDAFLLSSVCEGISNAALEAMACGLAVVSTRCGGMEEAVQDGVDGLLVPTRDPGAMAEALARLARDPGLRSRLGASARRRIETDFRLEDQVEAFRRLCLEVVG